MRLTASAVLLCLIASTPIHAAPEESDWITFDVTGSSLNIICNDRNLARCEGIVMMFHDLIKTGDPIDGKHLCWPGGLSRLVS